MNNIVHFGETTCEKIRRYLDSYISNELLVETNHEVLKHIDGCASCAAELEARTRVRSELRAAVRGQAVPPDLEARVRARIRHGGARPFASEWSRWMVAAAAVMIVVLGSIMLRARYHALPALADRPGQDRFIQRVSSSLAAVLRLGIADHVHCAVFRKYPSNPPSVAQMAETLGPVYKGLLPVIEAAVPREYRIVMAHQCGYHKRTYVHVTLERGSSLVSLVITRRQPGETMQSLTPSLRAGGVTVYESAAERFQVAGFETAEYLAYVVSDLGARQNLQVAMDVAPGVHRFLTGLGS